MIIDEYNIRYCNNLVIILENYIILRSASKIIRKIDIIREERNYILIEFSRKKDLIDIRTRVNMQRLLKRIVATKYYYCLNLHGLRDRLINSSKIIVEHVRYSSIEI